MTDEDLDLFDEFDAECVHLSPQEEQSTSTVKSCCCHSKYFNGNMDTIRHLKTFRAISNEIPILLLIL